PSVAFTLRNLILVVRKEVIHAAGVNVDLLAQMLDRHRAALDMPAGESTAPRAIPGHIAARLGQLPKRKVLGVAPVEIGYILDPAEHALELITRELAVAGEAPHVEEHVPTGRVCQFFTLEPLHDPDHIGDMVSGFWEDVCRQNIQLPLILVERSGVESRDLGRGLALLAGLGNQLV